MIPQRNKLKFDLHLIDRFNLTQKQKDFIDLVLDKNTKMVFVDGPAGTTKSFLTIYCALKLLNERRMSDIIYVRSVVECSEKSVGYLPGTLDEKISIYLQPLVDKLAELHILLAFLNKTEHMPLYQGTIEEIISTQTIEI